MTNLIRFILTMVLVVLVYMETGVWTALSFGLIFIGLELNGVSHKRFNKEIEFLKSFAELSGYGRPKDKGLN